MNYDLLISNTLKEPTPSRYAAFALGLLLFLDADATEMKEESKLWYVKNELHHLAPADELENFLRVTNGVTKKKGFDVNAELDVLVKSLREVISTDLLAKFTNTI